MLNVLCILVYVTFKLLNVECKFNNVEDAEAAFLKLNFWRHHELVLVGSDQEHEGQHPLTGQRAQPISGGT